MAGDRLGRVLAHSRLHCRCPDYDAVHLTAAGYLTTAGWPVPVGEARTVLAGWNPDETYWLTDVLTHAGPAAHWERQEDMLTWALATPGTGPPNA